MKKYIKLAFLFVLLISSSGCLAFAAGALVGVSTYGVKQLKEKRVDSEFTSVKHVSNATPYKNIAVGVASDNITISAKIEHEFAD